MSRFSLPSSFQYIYVTIMVELIFGMHSNVTYIAHFWDQWLFHGVLKEFFSLKLLITLFYNLLSFLCAYS